MGLEAKADIMFFSKESEQPSGASSLANMEVA